jgi:hypothetical protein
MPPYKAYQTRPVTADLPGDPYRSLVLAVLERAISDAQGLCHMRGDDRPADRVQREARAWLTGQGAVELLSLAGYDPDPVLRQVRRVLER